MNLIKPFLFLNILFLVACDKKVSTCDIADAFPIDYSIDRDSLGNVENVFVYGDDPEPLKLHVFPWAPHAEPHTGHPGADIKANMMAHFIFDMPHPDAEDISGDNNICDKVTDTCGLSLARMRARWPQYRAPKDQFKVTRVVLSHVHSHSDIYVGSYNQWRIETETCQYHYSFGHVAWIGEDLRQAILAQGGPDPRTYSGPTNTNLLSRPVTLKKGQSIAAPQVIGKYVASHPEFVQLGAKAQIEFPTRNLKTGNSVPIYKWITQELRDALTATLQKEMNSAGPDSEYYNPLTVTLQPWLYLAEGALWTVDKASKGDYSGLTNNAEAWFEFRSGCSATPSHPLRERCNDAFAIWPINKSTPVYNASLYESGSSFLVLKSQALNPEDRLNYWRGEVLTPKTELGKKGTLLIKWRLRHYYEPLSTVTYQKATYDLNSSAKVLKIHWGPESANRGTIESGSNPSDPRNLNCNGTNVVCYNHDWPTDGVYRPGF